MEVALPSGERQKQVTASGRKDSAQDRLICTNTAPSTQLGLAHRDPLESAPCQILPCIQFLLFSQLLGAYYFQAKN